MKLSAVSTTRRKAEIVFEKEGEPDEVLNVVFNPMAYTASFENAVAEIAEQEPSMGLVLATTTLLLEWDLEDDDGPIPLEEDAVKNVPIGVLAQIFRQIRMLSQPSSEEGKGSAGGSQPVETSESSLTGTP